MGACPPSEEGSWHDVDPREHGQAQHLASCRPEPQGSEEPPAC